MSTQSSVGLPTQVLDSQAAAENAYADSGSSPPSPQQSGLVTVEQAATFLGVSWSWIRRHLNQLPHVRVGRLIRFDADQLRATLTTKALEPKRITMPNRFQRGGVRLRGKVWYGFYRIDTPSGRKQKEIPLGDKKELPTKTEARNKLAKLMAEPEAEPTKVSLTFSETVEAWKQAEGPTMSKPSQTHYYGALRAYVEPTLGKRLLDSIQRDDISALLNSQASKYSESSLKVMRLVCRMVLGWAERSGKIVRPAGWLDNIRLPRKTGGRRVERTQLETEQVLAIASQLDEPYSTLVLFLYATGKRGEEAAGIQTVDLDDDNILHIRRVVYDGQIEELEQEELIPLDGPEHRELVGRMRKLGKGHKWLFHGPRKDTPLNLSNVRRRYLHPACAKVGVKVGGWHDFRHTLQSKMRRSGVDPVVRAGVMGHKQVELGPEVYDKASLDEKRAALAFVGRELLAKPLANASVQ
jgi:excisionase family DNA binding protein